MYRVVHGIARWGAVLNRRQEVWLELSAGVGVATHWRVVGVFTAALRWLAEGGDEARGRVVTGERGKVRRDVRSAEYRGWHGVG